MVAIATDEVGTEAYLPAIVVAFNIVSYDNLAYDILGLDIRPERLRDLPQLPTDVDVKALDCTAAVKLVCRRSNAPIRPCQAHGMIGARFACPHNYNLVPK
jgi:hypothetical protein